MTPLPFEDLPEKPRRGSRLPETWYPPESDILFAESLGLTPGQTALEADKFRDYWTALPGQRARKLDWSKTWRNWLRRDYAKNIDALKAGIVNGAFHGESLESIASNVKRAGTTWARCRYPRDVLEQCLRTDPPLLTRDEVEAAL